MIHLPKRSKRERHQDHLTELEERLGLPADADARDQRLGDSAERLAQFVQSDVWTQDVLPLLESWAQRAITIMTDPRAEAAARAEMAGTYRTCTGLINALGGRVELGRKAVRELAKRRLGPEAVLE